MNKFRSAFADLPVNFKEPDEEGLNSAQFNYMKDYFNAVEALLYAPDFPAAGEYAELLDTDSFIDWWIVQELTHNQDTRLPGSCYMNKDRLGKLKAGPVWDFDLTTFIDSRSFLLKDESANNHSWFPRLFRDPAFLAARPGALAGDQALSGADSRLHRQRSRLHPESGVAELGYVGIRNRPLGRQPRREAFVERCGGRTANQLREPLSVDGRPDRRPVNTATQGHTE